MGCGYSTKNGSKKRGRLKVTDEDDDVSGSGSGSGGGGGSDDEEGFAEQRRLDRGSDKYRRLTKRTGSGTSGSDSSKKNGLLETVRRNEKKEDVEDTEEETRRRNITLDRTRPPISGPMRPPINRSASQLSFFRMLDEKIANGRDLDDEDGDGDGDDVRRTAVVEHPESVEHDFRSPQVCSVSDDLVRVSDTVDDFHGTDPLARTRTNGQVTS